MFAAITIFHVDSLPLLFVAFIYGNINIESASLLARGIGGYASYVIKQLRS